MKRLLVRSAISTLITACFALSVVSWGWMPGCVIQTATPAAHAHGSHPDHSHQSGNLPGSNQCTVHLCCLQLGGTAQDSWSSGRLGLAERSAGPVGKNAFIRLRPSHSLPFAHAPPLTPIS
jgi:hypothetical protein